MIKLLLDTNVLLWYFFGSDRIASVREMIVSENTEVYFSTVSLWEIALKVRTGKLGIDIDRLIYFTKKYSFYELPMTREYIKTYLELPFLHKDPFDHMLLAQAITTPLRFITGDSLLAQYSSLVITI